jgi:hypothetical protein
MPPVADNPNPDRARRGAAAPATALVPRGASSDEEHRGEAAHRTQHAEFEQCTRDAQQAARETRSTRRRKTRSVREMRRMLSRYNHVL